MQARRVHSSGRSRRVWAQPLPVGRKKRFRWLRRLIKVVAVAALLALAGWIYILQVYAPGLRVEARTVPARVRAELAQQGAGYVQLSAISPYLRQAIVAIED